eukprot:6213238-Pyramimonas_sp.AAC.1
MAQSQSTHPPVDQDAGILCFRMYMCTSLFFFGVLTWLLQWKSRPQSMVIAIFEMLSEFCKALPGSFDLYLGEGVSIRVTDMQTDVQHALAVLGYLGIARTWHALGVDLPRLDAGGRVHFRCLLFA